MDKVKSLEETEVTGAYNGKAALFYRFTYNHVDEKWHEGQVLPVHEVPKNLDKLNGIPMSFWTVGRERENEMKELTSLHLVSHSAFMQPLFYAYNSQIEKVVMACSPGNSEFTKWISKQTQIPLDGYIPVQGKNMISSILSFGDTLWRNGYVCTGLSDPNNYRMMDSKIKVVPFKVRKKMESDVEMIHRLDFSSLLENEIYPKWKDPDLKEFIALMKNPAIRLEYLLLHPLLLDADERLALYQTLWPGSLSVNQFSLLRTIPSFGKWREAIAPTDELYDILVYDKNRPPGAAPKWMYGDGPDEAFRFGCNTSSHYTEAWRANTYYALRSIPKGQADESLKKVLPGLLSKVYGLSLHHKWKLNKGS